MQAGSRSIGSSASRGSARTRRDKSFRSQTRIRSKTNLCGATSILRPNAPFLQDSLQNVTRGKSELMCKRHPRLGLGSPQAPRASRRSFGRGSCLSPSCLRPEPASPVSKHPGHRGCGHLLVCFSLSDMWKVCRNTSSSPKLSKRGGLGPPGSSALP